MFTDPRKGPRKRAPMVGVLLTPEDHQAIRRAAPAWERLGVTWKLHYDHEVIPECLELSLPGPRWHPRDTEWMVWRRTEGVRADWLRQGPPWLLPTMAEALAKVTEMIEVTLGIRVLPDAVEALPAWLRETRIRPGETDAGP